MVSNRFNSESTSVSYNMLGCFDENFEDNTSCYTESTETDSVDDATGVLKVLNNHASILHMQEIHLAKKWAMMEKQQKRIDKKTRDIQKALNTYSPRKIFVVVTSIPLLASILALIFAIFTNFKLTITISWLILFFIISLCVWLLACSIPAEPKQ